MCLAESTIMGKGEATIYLPGGMPAEPWRRYWLRDFRHSRVQEAEKPKEQCLQREIQRSGITG
jgi:hypothetical protein